MVIRSAQFDDIYFSVEDGFAETRHVFLGGNDLPQRWQGRDRFCIAELGFGTGLNILAAWQLFDETSAPHQHLDIVSVEKYPLNKDQIRDALAVWKPQLGRYLDRLIDVYPIAVPGFHRIHLSDRVTLTLIFDDVQAALREVQAGVDAWFMDGFAPAKNPDMWNGDVFTQMARLSNTGATLATFTAAGDVRRGLATAGFEITKTKGYGRKRDMTIGRFTGTRQQKEKPLRVAIVGAGLAGASAAWHLQREGIDVDVYEAGAQIACGASGNSTGIINPKLTVQRGAQSDYYTAAFAYARRHLPTFEGCGSLHLQLDDDKARRFAGYIANLGWGADHMRLLDVQAASDVAAIRLDRPALFYPDAGTASPQTIAKELLKDISVHLNARIDHKPDADIIIYAAAHDAITGLNLQRVRGQVSRLKGAADIKTNICYGGYITPSLVCGATFQPWDEDPSVRAEDHARNLEQLASAVPSLPQFEVAGGWTGFRAASKDRFPIIGAHNGTYLTVAHGSHGMISGFLGGAILSSLITGAPLPVGVTTLAALGPARLDSMGKAA